MKSIASLLKKTSPIQVKNLKKNVDTETIFFVFKKVLKEEFGNTGAAKFIPNYLSKKTLFAAATSSAWASELWTNRAKIIRRLNQELGGEIIEEIKIK